MHHTTIRPETAGDANGISRLLMEAFATHPHSNQTEHLLVEELRKANALDISLVAVCDGLVVGHVGFSKVTINGEWCSWYGLAPLAVLPLYQRHGIGSQLMHAGLEELKSLGAKGCVLVGDPNYYQRFCFKADPALTLDGVPPEVFLSLPLCSEPHRGKVEFHKAFDICG